MPAPVSGDLDSHPEWPGDLDLHDLDLVTLTYTDMHITVHVGDASPRTPPLYQV